MNLVLVTVVHWRKQPNTIQEEHGWICHKMNLLLVTVLHWLKLSNAMNNYSDELVK